jgi:hypothetical protein
MEVDSSGQNAGPLKADSVAVALGQALQAQDKALLERCAPEETLHYLQKLAGRLQLLQQGWETCTANALRRSGARLQRVRPWTGSERGGLVLWAGASITAARR